MKARDESIKSGNQRYFKLKNQKTLNDKLNESYQ